MKVVWNQRIGQISEKLLENISQVDDIIRRFDAFSLVQQTFHLPLPGSRTCLPEQSLDTTVLPDCLTALHNE